MPPTTSPNSWIPLSSGRSTGRARRVWGLIFPLFFVLATCSAGPKPEPDESPGSDRPIRPADEQKQLKFDRARTALESGDYEQAKETFRLIQAEEGDGEVAQLAELYVARAELGDLVGGTDGKGEPRSLRPERGLRMLESLGADESVDPRVRGAARLYEAHVRLENDESERFREIGAALEATSVGSAVLEAERLAMWPVLIEALREADRHAEAIEASAELFEAVEGRAAAKEERSPEADIVAPAPPDEGSEDASTETPAAGDDGAAESDSNDPEGSPDVGKTRRAELAEFARNRGFDSAAQLGGEAIEKRLDADSGFVRAVVGWTYLERTLEEGDLDGQQREELDERLAEVGADLNAIGASTRVSELSIKMATAGGSERLVVAALVPLSGANTSIGQRALSGMLLAMQAFRRRGPARVTLVIEDANAPPEEVWSRLDRVEPTAIIGPLEPERAATFAPGAQEREVPMIALTARRPTERADTSEPYVVRNFMDPITEARAAANLAFHEFGDRRAAVVYPSMGYGETLQKAFQKEFRRLGGQIAEAIAYDRSGSNYSQVANRLAGKDIETVFIPDSGSKVAEISAFLADRDIWGIAPSDDRPTGDGRTHVHYLGTSLWYGPILKRQAASYLQGAVIPTWFASEFADQPTRQFARRFDVVYGRTPGNIEAFAYDNVHWVRRLMVEHGVQTAGALRTRLLSEKPHAGATGRGAFDAGGTLWRTMRFVRVADQTYKPLDLQVEIAPAGRDRGEGGETDQPVDGPEPSETSPTP